MINKRVLLSRSRFVLFLAGIALLGSISAPLHAADAPPSMWDKVFGNESKTDSVQPSKNKAKKAKNSKSTQKTHNSTKLSKQSKPSEAPSTTDPKQEAISATQADSKAGVDSEPALSDKNAPEGSGSFWKDLFGKSSSSSPINDPVDKTSGNPPTTPSPSPDTAPSNTPSSNATVAPSTPSEATNQESFWKRVFGKASSAPPESKTEPAPPANTATAPASTTAPIVMSPVTDSGNANSPNKTSAVEEEPSFWQKLFGKKSNSNTKSPQAENSPAQQSANTNPVAIVMPEVVAPSSSSTVKTNFGLVNVCERERCELMILYDAPINKATVEKFVNSTASIPAGTAVLFNSVDGDLNSGLRLGQVLRQKRFNSRIGRTSLNKKTLVEIDGQCFSACVLAFAGGVNRRIDPNDQLGIYALRSNTKKVNEEEMRVAVNSLGSYFDQMGVDRRLVDHMLQAKGTTVSLFSLSNTKLLNLDNSTRVTTYPWRMQALDDRLLIALVTEKQASGQFSVTLGLTKQNKDFQLTIFVKPTSGTTNLNQLSDFLNRNARVQLSFSNQILSLNLLKPWEATSSGVQATAILNEKDLSGISSALEFELDFAQISRNAFNLDGVTIFGTSGLKGALTAIKK